ncbi:MAG: c-type cytochrome [Shinella sp.]|uniref:c-type cytochrome n=1 Tax=Shinella sp. TaxID=1870904 RepID=UPI004036D316
MTVLLPAAPAFADGDPLRGKTVFNRCGTCHSTTGQNRMGPSLDGVVGRLAGASTGARYSSALKGSGVVWNDETLDRFLQAPRTLVPGTTMMIGLAQAQDRADIIAYLKTLAAAGADSPQP